MLNKVFGPVKMVVEFAWSPHENTNSAYFLCRYYRQMHACMSEWLQSQRNCSDEVADAVLAALEQLPVPWMPDYNCSVTIITTTTTMPGSFCAYNYML